MCGPLFFHAAMCPRVAAAGLRDARQPALVGPDPMAISRRRIDPGELEPVRDELAVRNAWQSGLRAEVDALAR